MIHHLKSEEKQAAFRDVKRLLRPGGRFHLLDFGPPKSGSSARSPRSSTTTRACRTT